MVPSLHSHPRASLRERSDGLCGTVRSLWEEASNLAKTSRVSQRRWAQWTGIARLEEIRRPSVVWGGGLLLLIHPGSAVTWHGLPWPSRT